MRQNFLRETSHDKFLRRFSSWVGSAHAEISGLRTICINMYPWNAYHIFWHNVNSICFFQKSSLVEGNRGRAETQHQTRQHLMSHWHFLADVRRDIGGSTHAHPRLLPRTTISVALFHSPRHDILAPTVHGCTATRQIVVDDENTIFWIFQKSYKFQQWSQEAGNYTIYCGFFFVFNMYKWYLERIWIFARKIENTHILHFLGFLKIRIKFNIHRRDFPIIPF